MMKGLGFGTSLVQGAGTTGCRLYTVHCRVPCGRDGRIVAVREGACPAGTDQLLCREGGTPEGPAESRAWGQPHPD